MGRLRSTDEALNQEELVLCSWGEVRISIDGDTALRSRGEVDGTGFSSSGSLGVLSERDIVLCSFFAVDRDDEW